MTLVRSRHGGNFRQSVIMPSKGLLNNPGENNCFMNSAVQVLWHLDVFRRSFRLLDGHACLEECCIFCALKEIFGKFQESDEAALPPDVLRIAMAKAFQDQRKFQIGRMGDAAECFENILRRLHYHIAFGSPEDTCNAKHCIPHQKFSMQILEQTFCKCGATSEPFNFFQIVNYVSASALIEEARQPEKNGYSSYKSFGQLLNVTLSLGESRQCPDEKKCLLKENGTSPTKMHKTLLNCPDIVCIGINWDTDRPSAEYVMDLLDCLGRKLDVKDLFDTLGDDRTKKMKLRLFGIMTYYGKHYTTFFYNTRQETWFYFDDARVKEIGKEWELVKDRCIRGRFQPLLVFYVNQDGEPIKANKAPRKTKIIVKDELLAVQNNNEVANQRANETIEREYPNKKVSKKEKGDEWRSAPAKRKSFKKMVVSAFKKDKTNRDVPDTSSSAKRQPRYNGDHVLSVNGHDTSLGVVGPYSEMNGQIEENKYADNESQTRKSPTKIKESTREGSSPSLLLDGELGSQRDSPIKVYGRSPQPHRLKRHQEHLKSLDSSLEIRGDVSDYDNLGSPKLKVRQGQSPVRKTSPGTENGGRKELGVEDQRDVREEKRGYSLGKVPDLEFKKQNQIQRRFIDQGDAYADAVDEAESLVISSIAAEQEDNLLESYHLCAEAKLRYCNAMDLEGITEKMQVHADMKRLETSNRMRMLSSKISEFRERSSKSADYERQISRTSDYGSLSDASGSPLAQNDCQTSPYQKFVKEIRRSSQDFHGMEKGGIQAKLNKERNRIDSSKNQNDPTKSIYFTLPRKKKSNHQHKLSAQEPPTQSEMEQLSDLLKNFDSSAHVDHRRRSRDFEKKAAQHKSDPYLAAGELGLSKHESVWNNGDRMKSEPSVVAPHVDVFTNPRTVSRRADQYISDTESSKSRPRANDGRMSNDDELIVSKKLDMSSQTRLNNQSKFSDKSSATYESSLKAVSNYSKPEDSMGTTRGSYALKEGIESPKHIKQNGMFRPDDSLPDGRHQIVTKSIEETDNRKPRSKSQVVERNPPLQNTGSGLDMLSDSEIRFDASKTKKIPSPNAVRVAVEQDSVIKNNTMKRQTSIEKELTRKPVERKKSILRIIPKIMSMERVRSVKERKKKPIDSREEEYNAMLNAQSQMKSRQNDSSDKLASNSNVEASREVRSARSYEIGSHRFMQDSHDKSYGSLETSEGVLNEVAAVTKMVTEKRLFPDAEAKRKLTQGSENRSFEEMDKKSSNLDAEFQQKEMMGTLDTSTTFSPVDRTRSPCRKEIRETKERSVTLGSNRDEGSQYKDEERRKRSSPSLGQPSSIADRFAVDNRKTTPYRANEYLKSATSQSNVTQKVIQKLEDGLNECEEGPASEGSKCETGRKIQEAIGFFSKSQPNISNHKNRNRKEPIEPPPRRNQYVYRSSELYKAKHEQSSIDESLKAPQPKMEVRKEANVNDQRSGYSQPVQERVITPRWGNGADFSMSTRQMCQQCGTVTVEKPRKFCRNCQSDYL